MTVLIMADLEGISGVYTREQVLPSQSRFNEGRKFLTKDINVCAAALKAAGVDKVYVRDCHGGSYALLWDEVSEDVDLVISGLLRDERFPFIDEIDAVILFGYHAMAGTAKGLLEHTFSSMSVQNYYLNGEQVGEIAFDAAILGEYETPVIMVSGDTNVCKEAKEFLPWVATAEVKACIAWARDFCRPIRRRSVFLPPFAKRWITSRQGSASFIRSRLPSLCAWSSPSAISFRSFFSAPI